MPTIYSANRQNWLVSVSHTDQLRINGVLKGGQHDCVIAFPAGRQNLTALEPDEKC